MIMYLMYLIFLLKIEFRVLINFFFGEVCGAGF